MRIISPFRDYYDTAMGYGQDKTLVYKRDTVEISGLRGRCLLWTDISNGRRWPQRRIDYSYAVWTLFFCGSVYPLYVVEWRTPKRRNLVRTFCWNEGEVSSSLKYKHLKKHYERYIKDDEKYLSRWWSPLTKSVVDTTFSETFADTTDLHHEYRCPVILQKTVDQDRMHRIVLNPVLKDIGFMSVVDPFTAYQEISMYLGGVLGRPEMEHRPISDEDMRDMKGFDERSFKQVSPGERKKRRRNKERKRNDG